jgi:hypothetical protein
MSFLLLLEPSLNEGSLSGGLNIGRRLLCVKKIETQDIMVVCHRIATQSLALSVHWFSFRGPNSRVKLSQPLLPGFMYGGGLFILTHKNHFHILTPPKTSSYQDQGIPHEQ